MTFGETRRTFGMSRCGALLMVVAVFGGCTIAKLERDNETATARIDAKTIDLKREQAKQARLTDAKAQLLRDLQSRDVSVQELSEQLETLSRLNEATAASNAQMLQQKLQTAKNLKDAAEQLRSAQRPNAGESPDAAAKRLADTRQKIRARLEIMLAN